MTIKSTYIVVHSSLVSRLKQITHFKMDLGTSIVNAQNMFQPNDVFIQKHYMFHGEIIHCLGHIGSLPVYSQLKTPLNSICFCNEMEIFDYKLNDLLSVYDNINTGLDLFFTKLGFKNNLSTVKETDSKTATYIQPNKPLSEYSESERIALLRSNRNTRIPQSIQNETQQSNL